MVPVYNAKGQQAGEVEIDPAALGGKVRHALIKQAIVSYLDRQRQDSARTKGKSDTEGSTRKLYRQKGTGNARMGQIRTPLRRGGGRTFAKRGPRTVTELPKKMRRLARNSALLAKIKAKEVMILDGFQCDKPRTREFAAVLSALGIRKGCVYAMHEPDRNTFLSGRNIGGTDIRLVQDLHAYDVLRREKLIFTRPAFEKLTGEGNGGA